MNTATKVPDTLPADIGEEQQYLFEDELLVLTENLAKISIKQSSLVEKRKTCKAAIIKEMNKLGIKKGAAQLADGEKLELYLKESGQYPLSSYFRMPKPEETPVGFKTKYKRFVDCMMTDDDILDLHTKCQRCKREIPEDGLYYMHPDYGIVCEYCPEFEDGRIKIAETSGDK